MVSQTQEEAETGTRAEDMAPGQSAGATFGFQDVPLDEKQTMVDAVFHKVARRYDLMNDLMSV